MSINLAIKWVSFLLIMLLCISNAAGNISCTTAYNPTRNINMGTYDPYNYTNIVIPIVMTITCTGSGSYDYQYTFDGGGGGDMRARRMALGGKYVSYNICTSSNCTQYYGNGSNGTYIVKQSYSSNTTTTNVQSWNLYWVVPVQPLSTPGVYSDTINVSISLNY